MSPLTLGNTQNMPIISDVGDPAMETPSVNTDVEMEEGNCFNKCLIA